MSRRADMHGFTLVELMTTVALLIISIAIAVPSFTSMVRNNQLQNKAEELKSLLEYARIQAVTQRRTYLLSPDPNAPSDSTVRVIRPRGGDVERKIVIDTAQAKILHSSLTDNTLEFRSNGTAAQARFTICRDADKTTGYLVEVKASGSIALSTPAKAKLTTCTP